MNDRIAEINSIAQLLLYRWRHIDIERPLIFSELLNNKKCVTTYYVLLIEGGMWEKGEVLDCDQSTKNSELGQRPPHWETYIYGSDVIPYAFIFEKLEQWIHSFYAQVNSHIFSLAFRFLRFARQFQSLQWVAGALQKIFEAPLFANTRVVQHSRIIKCIVLMFISSEVYMCVCVDLRVFVFTKLTNPQ